MMYSNETMESRAPIKASEIEILIREIEKQIIETRDKVEALCARLTPVISQKAPQGPQPDRMAEKDRRNADSPMGIKLQDFSNQLSEINRRLIALMDSLEI